MNQEYRFIQGFRNADKIELSKTRKGRQNRISSIMSLVVGVPLMLLTLWIITVVSFSILPPHKVIQSEALEVNAN